MADPVPATYSREVKKAQILGLVLWRGGLLLVGATALYYGARQLLRFVELPLTLQVGGSLILAGVILVLASMIMENVAETRGDKSRSAEGGDR